MVYPPKVKDLVALASHEAVVGRSAGVGDDPVASQSAHGGGVTCPKTDVRAVRPRAVEDDAVRAGRAAGVHTTALDGELHAAREHVQSRTVGRQYLVVGAGAVHLQVLVVPVHVRVRVRAYTGVSAGAEGCVRACIPTVVPSL
jgi:hypothetical protein